MHIDLKLGLACNNACIHCIMEPVRKSLLAEGGCIDSTTGHLESIVRSLESEKPDSITLTGGEPTLRRDFFDILEMASTLNAGIIVQTNGRLLAGQEESLRRFAGRDILFVIALHGASASLHDRVTRRPGSFAQTLEGLRTVQNMGFRICGKMVLSNINVGYIGTTLGLMKELALDECIVAFPHAEDFSPEDIRMVVPTYSLVRQQLMNLEASDVFFNRVNWETIPFCQLPYDAFQSHSIDLDYLKEKIQHRKINIEMSMTGQSIDWQTTRQEIKAKPASCGYCLFDHICEGVWAEYISVYGGEEFKPIRDIETAAALERLL